MFCNRYLIPSFCYVIKEFVKRHIPLPLPQPFSWIPLKLLNDPRSKGPDNLIPCWLMLKVKFHTNSISNTFKQGTNFLGFPIRNFYWALGNTPKQL
jgi:hypothetical protein